MFGSLVDIASGSLGSVGSSDSANPLPKFEEHNLPDGVREAWQNLPFGHSR